MGVQGVLVSTDRGYVIFIQVHKGGGLNGGRILAPLTVELRYRKQLPDPLANVRATSLRLPCSELMGPNGVQ